MYKFVQSRTGMIHLASEGSYNATPCNSRNRGFHVSGALSKAMVERALYSKVENAFCGKCFPDGKPTQEAIEKFAK